jgi:hypothetical protein
MKNEIRMMGIRRHEKKGEEIRTVGQSIFRLPQLIPSCAIKYTPVPEDALSPHSKTPSWTE